MMTSKSTPTLNGISTRRSKRSTAGINSLYNQTPSSIQKSSQKSAQKTAKSTSLNVNATSFTSKNISTSRNKSSVLEEIKQLETRLENQIFKTNAFEKELEGLKKENNLLKTELQSKLNNIKLTINKENNKDVDHSISEGTVSNEQNVESVLDFNVVRDNTPAALTPQSVPFNDEREIPRKDYLNAVKKSAPVSVFPQEIFPSNNNVHRARNGSIKNDPYPVQPLVRRKTKCTDKPNLLVGDSLIKRVKKDLIVHHMNNKNISLKCKNFCHLYMKINSMVLSFTVAERIYHRANFIPLDLMI